MTTHPGTTRDTLEETIQIEGLELLLVDTAGGREVREEVEQLGIERTKEATRQADMVWFLIDAEEGVTEEDEQWLEHVVQQSDPEQARFFLLINKVDLKKTKGKTPPLELHSSTFSKTFPKHRQFLVSAKTGEGIDEFLKVVKTTLIEQSALSLESDLLVNQRHEQTLGSMTECFTRIDEAFQTGLSLECVVTDLWQVKGLLDELDGTKSRDDLLGEIFSRFCIGK